MPSLVILRTLTRRATRSSPITLRHLRQCCFHLAQIRLRIVQGTQTPLAMMALYSALMPRQSLRESLQSSPETKLTEIVAVCRHPHVDLPGYD